jgi:metal-responsive CopG/Arc/MetJ family transcriptional regulator
MGFHKTGLVSIGAYIESELRDYLDQFAKEHGFSTRSDALREIIHQHRSLFLKKCDGNMALTPLEVVGDDNPQGSVCKKIKSNKR